MRDLKRERERLGISRQEVATQTRIPLRYVTALEDGEAAARHPGPFLFGYRKQYEAFLDTLEPGVSEPGVSEPGVSAPGVGAPPGSASAPGGEPDKSLAAYVRADAAAESTDSLPSGAVPVARLVIAGFVATLGVVLVLKLGAAIASRPAAPPPVPVIPTQTVDIRSTEPTKVTVTADGQTLFTGTLEPGKTQTFEGHTRLEVDAADLTVVTVRHNGDRIEPLGNLSDGRRLVFIQEQP